MREVKSYHIKRPTTGIESDFIKLNNRESSGMTESAGLKKIFMSESK